MQKELEKTANLESKLLQVEEDVAKINTTVCNLEKVSKDSKNTLDILIKIVRKNEMQIPKVSLVFFTATLVYMMFNYSLTLFSGQTLNDLEVFSSWATMFLCGGVGMWGAYKICKHQFKKACDEILPHESLSYKLSPYMFAILSAPIFTCYLGYVTIDFGSMFPIAAAIGFNVATIAANIVTVMLLVEKYGSV